MKTHFTVRVLFSRIASLVFLCFAVHLSAGSDKNQLLKDKLKKEISIREAKFVENKGQMKDMAGKPVDFVLFKVQSSGLDLYITTKGLTYVFYEVENEEEEENERKPNSFSIPSVAVEEKKKRETRWERLDLELKGAQISSSNVITEQPVTGHFNYFDSHCPNGIYGVKEYERVTIKNIYPGIDWVFYNVEESGFKYDFIVHPGADAKQIGLIYTSGKKPFLDPDGSLKIPGRLGDLVDHAPVSYCSVAKSPIASSFILKEVIKEQEAYKTTLGFEVDGIENGYCDLQDVTIDPQITWATFYGDSGTEGTYTMDTDSLGNLFASGYSTSGTNFPTFNAGTYFQSSGGGYTPVILKFDNNGLRLWVTYYSPLSGWSGNQSLYTIVTDRLGNVFLCGNTQGSITPVQNAGTYFQAAGGGNCDAFIIKFDNAGNRLWATYYGGSGSDIATGATVDAGGNLFVTGVTTSPNFPLQNNGTFFQSTISSTVAWSGFILKFDNVGNRLWASYFGYSIFTEAIESDINGNIFISGGSYSTSSIPLLNPGGTTWYQPANAGSTDAFISRFSNTGVLLWSTHYGGSGSDFVSAITTDPSGNLFVTGTTDSQNLPVLNSGNYFQGSLNGIQDVFLLKFSGAGTRLWATYFGGNGWEGDGNYSYSNMGTDQCGNVYLGFLTSSTVIPIQASCSGGYLDASPNGLNDAFICRFSNSGALDWATYFGGNGTELRMPIAVDRTGNLFLSGEWIANTGTFNAATYPLTNPGSNVYYDATQNGSDDMYFAKFGSFSQNFFSYQPVCVGATNLASPILAPGFNGSGSFSAGPGLNLNSANGQITIAGSLPGVYTVTFTPVVPGSSCSCFVSAISTATFQLSMLSATTSSAAVCLGGTVTLMSNVVSSSAATYSWLPQGPSTQHWMFSPLASSIYTLLVQNANGCNASSLSSVTVHSLPVVTALGSTVGCTGDPFFFSGQGALTYYWSFGVTSPTVSFIPSSTNFILTGTDANGCSASTTIKVRLEDCVGINEQVYPKQFKVYPNPARGEFVIEGEIDLTISVENNLGQTLRTLQLDPKNLKVVVTDLPPGIYFVRGAGRNGSTVHKIILNEKN